MAALDGGPPLFAFYFADITLNMILLSKRLRIFAIG